MSVKLLTIHGFFAPAGLSYTSPESGTVARESVPPVDAEDASDNAIWLDLGIIDDATKEAGYTGTIEVWKGTPGRKQLSDEIGFKPNTLYNLTLAEWSVLQQQLENGAYVAADALSSGNLQYNPHSGDFFARGWLKTQEYDQNDALIDARDCFGILRMTTPRSRNGESNTAQASFRVLYSTKNSGIITPTP